MIIIFVLNKFSVEEGGGGGGIFFNTENVQLEKFGNKRTHCCEL